MENKFDFIFSLLPKQVHQSEYFSLPPPPLAYSILFIQQIKSGLKSL